MLEWKEVEKPQPEKDEMLIKIVATSLNSSDNELLTGSPIYTRMWGLLKPKNNILGSDIAGIVEKVGSEINKFRVGDKVFGDNFEKWGGLAEYVCLKENDVMLKPESLTFEECAALPQASVVALQGLRDKCRIKTNDKVLIVGAGGGSGTFAIQIAKLYDTEVTAVDNTSKLELMLQVGADHVIDYTKRNCIEDGKQYDLILDFVASHSIFEFRRILSPGGNYAMVGGSVPRLLQVLIFGPIISITSKKMGLLMHKQNLEDLGYILELIESGIIKPVIDKCYPLKDVSKAFHNLGQGKAKGKLIITPQSS